MKRFGCHFLQVFDDDGFQDWEPLLSVDEQDGRSYGNVGKASHWEVRSTKEDDELEIVSTATTTAPNPTTSFLLKLY